MLQGTLEHTHLSESWLSPGLRPGAGLLGPVVVLSFSGTLHPALRSGCRALRALTVPERRLPPPSPALVTCRLSADGRSDGCAVLCVVGLVCASLMAGNVGHRLVSRWPSVCLWKRFCAGLLLTVS